MSTEPETVAAPAAPRIVPGLGSLAPTSAKSVKRSRNKGAKGAKDAAVNGDAPVSDAVAAPAATSHGHPTLNLDSVSLEPLPDLQRPSASSVVAKRIKTATKKIQRIQAYQDQTESLNPDQQRAVASKPGLEATVKELQEIVKVLEADEAEYAKASEHHAVETEKRVHARMAVAVAEAKKHSQQDLTTLLQFFHLRSLFMPGNGINPPTLPPVVANATGQEGAAVMTLAEALENGPLMGGDDDAFERIEKLHRGDETSTVHADITYGRIKQMILDLTAPPAELGNDSVHNEDLGPTISSGQTHAHTNGSSYPELTSEGLRPEEEEAASEAHANLAANNGPALTFMQDSELEEQAAAAPAQTDSTPWGEPTPIVAPTAAASTGTWDDVPASIGNWADEVDEATAADREVAQAPQIQPLEEAAPAPIDTSAVLQAAEPTAAAATPAVDATPVENGASSGVENVATGGRGRGSGFNGRRGGGRGGAAPNAVPAANGAQGDIGWVSPAYRGKNPRPRPPNASRSNAAHTPQAANVPAPEPVEDGWNRVEKKHGGDDASRSRGGRGRGGRGRGGDRGRGGMPRTGGGNVDQTPQGVA